MFNRLLEQWAARSDPRFQAFVAGKEAYESFVSELGVRFDEMSEQHYRRAREDARLQKAAQRYIAAIEESETEGALADAAIAKIQLGYVRHVCGELDEAARLLRAALAVLSNLANRSSDMSACHYHLGIIALKQNRLSEAVGELRRSRQIDEVNADVGGIQSCDLALEACAEAGADIDADYSFSNGETSYWNAALEETAVPVADDSAFEPQVESGPVRYDRREQVWLASYSEQANDVLMANLDSLGDAFGRPVSVSRVAFGSADPTQRRPPQPELDQHVCATILVLERAGLTDSAFQELAAACMRWVITEPDFRLLVYLHDLTLDELRELSEHDPLIALLFDTTQIAEAPSLEQLRRTLVPFVRQIEQLRAAAAWSSLRLRWAEVGGSVATALLVVMALTALLGFPAWLLNADFAELGPYAPPWASFVLGVLAFPAQAPLIFLLLRGMRLTAIAPRDNASLVRWVIVSGFVLLGASHLQHQLDGPQSWLFLGLASGVALDAMRRAGRQARRQRIDLEAQMKRANDPATQDPKATVLRGDPLNPFSCPLLPAPSARVFISYTRRSAQGSRLASALHQGLKSVGAAPFLDRASIPAGASWRRDLDQHLSLCDVFVCILDEKSVQSAWVAAELLASIEAHRLTGSPEIFVLMDPAIQQQARAMLPVFQGVVAASASPQVPGRPHIIALNAQTPSSIIYGLAPGRYMPTSVFTRMAALPIMYVMSLLAWIGGLGILTGPILGFLAVLERTSQFPLAAGLADRDWLEAMTLLTSFWLGFMARATIAWGFEIQEGRQRGIMPPVIATCGLAIALVLFIPKAPLLYLCWSAVLMIAGWMMVAWAIRTGAAAGVTPKK